MASTAEWLDAFLHYDFDDSYFNDVNVDVPLDLLTNITWIQCVIAKMKQNLIL